MEDPMAWREYRLARGAGYAVWDSLASAFFNKELPSRQAEIAAKRDAVLARIEKLDPERAAKIRSDDAREYRALEPKHCGICGRPLPSTQVTFACDECEEHKFE
jgi:mono/diheme cytochrome c family protein